MFDAIWDTLPEDFLPPLSDEWTAEVQNRTAEYDAGGVKTVPWDQVKAEALSRLAATRHRKYDFPRNKITV